MFRKILIANRGEIAIRIMRACRELGVRTVAVYSDADRSSPHTLYADEVINIGAPASRDSYLRMDKIITAAKRSGAEAIHPGYGFLSERAEFALAVAEAGIGFIGPTASAIAAMGSKTAARTRMKAVGVPVAPGVEEPVSDPKIALQIAKEIGFPLLIKAAHGGGGKGMRKVFRTDDLPNSLEAAMRESLAAFNSREVYLERFIENPHHIEFQILADKYGNVIHLGERECSIQRRHQKLIEESPSPFMTPELREVMGQAAVKAALAVNYENAGTIEFLVDAQRNFYFLEMNTRLQVEHPVTEFVTGIDIVKAQLQIAAGEPLPWKQEDVKQNGWAIEGRICSEDPLNQFLPSTGRIVHLRAPSGPGVRDDRGVNEGNEVTLHYDSLIAKLIVYGATRDEAIARMKRALDEYHIIGIKTTIPFLHCLMGHPVFVGGNYNTGFLENEIDQVSLTNRRSDVKKLVALATALYEQKRTGNLIDNSKISTQTPSERNGWKQTGRWDNLRKR
ncbi:MAG: acetyl-CoA carboxylase biotin carboxylase subunit [bacterium]|nr:acetyl-CoA carboxylase biotin carboxylase subunit [bacterium]